MRLGCIALIFGAGLTFLGGQKIYETWNSGKLQTMPAEELAVLLNGAMNFGVMWAGNTRDVTRLHRIKTAVKRLFKMLRA